MRVTILALLGAFGLVSTAAGQPYPDADSPSGGALILAVWDDVANVSLVWALPALTYQDLRDRRLGLFNEPVPGLAATFAGSDAANIQYTVLAAGLYAPGFPETPQPALFATVPGNSSFASVLNTNVLGAYIAITSFYDALQNECASRNPCSTTDPQSGVFAARLLDVGLQLPFPVATSFGSSLRFFDIAQTGFRDNTLPPQFPPVFQGDEPATSVRYGTGAGWFLTSPGELFFTPVVIPLPAGVWLFLSAGGLLCHLRLAGLRRQSVT